MPPIESILFVLLLVIAVFMVRAHNLFTAVMLGGIFSLLCTGIYTLADAVDVAFTEAAVGAGVSTVLFLATLSLTGEEEAPRGRRSGLAILVVAVVGCALLYGTADMPGYGDYAAAPIHHHVVPRYIEASPHEVGMPNFVTSVLASYRGFDTFGETTVVFTAAVGVLLLLRTQLVRPGAAGRSILPAAIAPKAMRSMLPIPDTERRVPSDFPVPINQAAFEDVDTASPDDTTSPDETGDAPSSKPGGEA